MAQNDPWKEFNPGDVDFVKQSWARIFGEQLKDDIAKQSPLYKKVCPSPEERIRRRATSLRALLHSSEAR